MNDNQDLAIPVEETLWEIAHEASETSGILVSGRVFRVIRRSCGIISLWL